MLIQGHKLILKALVGSHSYGTNIEGSDMDYKGIFIQDPKDTYINGYKEQIEVSKDEVYFELGRFLDLCGSSNPTMLELLFTPDDCIAYKDPMFGYLIEARSIFMSKSLRHSFAGYAISQIKKASGLEKKMNWEKDKKVRKSVEDCCWVYSWDTSLIDTNKSLSYPSEAVPLVSFIKYNELVLDKLGLVMLDHMRNCYLLFYDSALGEGANNRFVSQDCDFRGIATEGANDVTLSVIPEYCTPLGILFFNKDDYSIHCKEYGEYERWLKERNVQRYVDIENHGQQIDGKNLLHCVRLIETALEAASTGQLRVKRDNAAYLIEIRKGKHDLKTLLAKCEQDIAEMDTLFAKSSLPDKVDATKTKDLETDIREDYYRSCMAEVAGTG